MQKGRPGVRLPSEGTGVIPHQKIIPGGRCEAGRGLGDLPPLMPGGGVRGRVVDLRWGVAPFACKVSPRKGGT